MTNTVKRISDNTLGYHVDGLTFTIAMDDLMDIHESDVAVGPHPYSAVTLARRDAPPDCQAPDCKPVLTATKQMLADWKDWCDGVAAAATAHFDDEPATPPTPGDIIQAMLTVGRIDEADEQRVAEVNAEDAAVGRMVLAC